MTVTESLNGPWPILHYSCSSSHVVFPLSSGAISSPFYFLSIYFQFVSVRTQIKCRILKEDVCLLSRSWNRFCPIFYQHAAAATISLWSRWHVCSFVMLFWKIRLLFVLQPGVSTDDALTEMFFFVWASNLEEIFLWVVPLRLFRVGVCWRLITRLRFSFPVCGESFVGVLQTVSPHVL